MKKFTLKKQKDDLIDREYPTPLNLRKEEIENEDYIKDYEIAAKVFEIDKNNLDEEVTKQSALMAQCVKIYRKKYEIKKKEELKLEMVEADLAEEVRNTPQDWGIDSKQRLTDTLVFKVIKKDPRYKIQYNKTNKAKADEKEWEGLIKACNQRGMDLRTLHDLWQSQYWGTDMVIREKRERRD